jgi:hypothetical protein
VAGEPAVWGASRGPAPLAIQGSKGAVRARKRDLKPPKFMPGVQRPLRAQRVPSSERAGCVTRAARPAGERYRRGLTLPTMLFPQPHPGTLEDRPDRAGVAVERGTDAGTGPAGPVEGDCLVDLFRRQLPWPANARLDKQLGDGAAVDGERLGQLGCPFAGQVALEQLALLLDRQPALNLPERANRLVRRPDSRHVKKRLQSREQFVVVVVTSQKLHQITRMLFLMSGVRAVRSDGSFICRLSWLMFYDPWWLGWNPCSYVLPSVDTLTTASQIDGFCTGGSVVVTTSDPSTSVGEKLP